MKVESRRNQKNATLLVLIAIHSIQCNSNNDEVSLLKVDVHKKAERMLFILKDFDHIK